MKKRVTGLGGVFFKSANPKALKEWYNKHLHIDSGEHGAMFKWRQLTIRKRKELRSGAYFRTDTITLSPARRILCSITGWKTWRNSSGPEGRGGRDCGGHRRISLWEIRLDHGSRRQQN